MSSHAHPLSDTEYYINHPDEYTKVMANKRRHESCQAFKPAKYKMPPKPPQPQKQEISVTANKDITETKDGAVFSTGDSYQPVASPL
jgi:hypothetical protein